MSCDVLVIAPHPDDAEIAAAGTILLLARAGRRVVLADLTRGEMATRGTPATRAAEAEQAARLMGVAARENLGLPDTRLRDDDATLAALVGLLRRHRPHLLLAPFPRDLHPDHEAAGQALRRAYFLAGLAKVLPDLGAPHRPELVVRYLQHDVPEVSFCVDVSAVVAEKRAVIRCYASQFSDDRSHFVRRLDPLERVESRDRFFGARLGCAAAEPFSIEGPLRLAGLDLLLGGRP